MESETLITLQCGEQVSLLELRLRRCENWLIQQQFHATEHLPDKEGLISIVFENCNVKTKAFLKKQNKTISTQGFQQESKWTTFLDKLNSSKPILNTLIMYLYKILVRELILKERDFKPFWTPAYKELSEKLLLPTETGCADLASSSSSPWLQSQVVKSPFLTIHTIEHQNKNLPTTCSQSFMSSLADKWEKGIIEPAKLKTIKIRLFPTLQQKKKLDEFIDTSRYVYNMTIEKINQGVKANHKTLRDMLVTANTKKGDLYNEFNDEIKRLKKQIKNNDNEYEIEDIKQVIEDLQDDMKKALKEIESIKNIEIKEFELKTPKDVRDNAVRRVIDARTTGFANLRNGNIKHFRMNFKKKTEPVQTVTLSQKNITTKKYLEKRRRHQPNQRAPTRANKNLLQIIILPEMLKSCGVDSVFRISRNDAIKHVNLKITHEVDICRKKGEYYLYVPIDTVNLVAKTITNVKTVGGVDPGLRTYATVHTHSIDGKTTTITEYVHRVDIMRKLNKKIKNLKKRRTYYRKKQYNKIEKKKTDFVNSLHWDVINDILKKNDVTYYGDIKSHNIVQGGKNKILNTDFNDLKFFIFKQRLVYKASLLKKNVFLTPEHYTTKCCSSCGTLNHQIGKKKVFTCINIECGLITGRDVNAPKNIKMKGMLS